MQTLYERAAPYLAEGDAYDAVKQSTFICTALAKASKWNLITQKEYEDLVNEIDKRLHPHCTVVTWLREEKFTSEFWALPTDVKRQQIQAYRHRWLKHLCEEYENSLPKN